MIDGFNTIFYFSAIHQGQDARCALSGTEHGAAGNYRKPAIKSADIANRRPGLIGIGVDGFGNVYVFNHSIFSKSETAANVGKQKFIKSPLIGKPIFARRIRAICPRLSGRLFKVFIASYNAVTADLSDLP